MIERAGGPDQERAEMNTKDARGYASLAVGWTEANTRMLIVRLCDEIDGLRRVRDAVKDACRHDRECEQEGEGECCYLAWRAVAVLAGEAKNLTESERALLLNDASAILGHSEPSPSCEPDASRSGLVGPDRDIQ